nr:hypothetical protein [Tanacetum cinerariifolium]
GEVVASNHERRHSHHGNSMRAAESKTSKKEASQTNKVRKGSKIASHYSKNSQRSFRFRQRKIQSSATNDNPNRENAQSMKAAASD